MNTNEHGTMDDPLKVLSETVAAVERELDLDWRNSYSRLYVDPGGRFVLELSREEVMHALLGRVGGFTVEAIGTHRVRLGTSTGQTVEVRLIGQGADTVLWVTSSVADLRKGPDHASELLSQAIMGETLCELRHEGDWHLVRLRDGYHGWIRSWYLAEVPACEVMSYEQKAGRMVRVNVGYIRTEPDISSVPVSDVVAGTRLITGERVGTFRRVTLPGGKQGYLREEEMGETVPARPDRRRIAERARRFLGIPYLWGGTSPKGFDCSGLVQRVFRMEGIELPRDSDRQAMTGSLIERDAVETALLGDLLFFGEGEKIDHVAISLGAARFIHAYGEVRVTSFNAGDSLYEEKLAGSLQFARSVLP